MINKTRSLEHNSILNFFLGAKKKLGDVIVTPLLPIVTSVYALAILSLYITVNSKRPIQISLILIFTVAAFSLFYFVVCLVRPLFCQKNFIKKVVGKVLHEKLLSYKKK